MSDREATFCPECGPDVEIDEEGCCLTCGATAVGSAAKDIARLQAVVDAARVVALTYCSENPGCNCCMCRLHQSLRALDGEVEP